MLWWVVLALSLFSVPLQAQGIKDFPRVHGVSSVTIGAPFLYFNLEPVVPQEKFRDWWQEMEQCAGVKKAFDEVAWYVADVIYSFAQNQGAWGIYYHTPPEIIIVRNRSEARIENTAKHEILHHLLRDNHDGVTFLRCVPKEN